MRNLERVPINDRKHLSLDSLLEIMPSPISRRDILCLCGVTFGLGTAGCLEDSPSGNGFETTVSNTTTQVESTTTHTPVTTSDRTTIALIDVSDEEAIERALAAEEEFLAEHFRNASCLTDWGVTPRSAASQTKVTKRTAEGVYVAATVEWYTTTEEVDDDGLSKAVYVVTADSIERVQGDSPWSPC